MIFVLDRDQVSEKNSTRIKKIKDSMWNCLKSVSENDKSTCKLQHIDVNNRVIWLISSEKLGSVYLVTPQDNETKWKRKQPSDNIYVKISIQELKTSNQTYN